MPLQQAFFSDFSGGYNDTMAAISILDKETALSENADYSAEVKALQTAKGCAKVNAASYGAEVTDGYSWTVGSQYKKCLVINGKVYDANTSTGAITERLTLSAGASQIYPFVIYDRFYFGDGTKLYVWGDVDYASELGTVDLKVGDIVRNNHSSSGTIGNFYQSKVARSGVDLKTDNYTNATNWDDVTDVRYASSRIVREVNPYDPAQKETVLISVTKGAAAAGTISIVLNNETFTCAIAANDTVPQIVDKLYNMTATGWTKTKISNGVRFTRNTAGLSENGYLDPGATGVTATYETITEGKDNDNNLDAIKKCTMFTVHPGSYRVFAAGNPDDNALYYSEIGKPTYFKSLINKVYPANGYGRITAISPLSEALLVSYQNGWYAWNGVTPLEDATWKPLNLPYGCACHNSLALTPYSFTYLANDGLYTVSASILNSELVLIQGKDIIKKITENRVEKTMRSISNKAKCRGIFHNNVYYLAFNTDGQKNEKVLKYEWDTKSFTIKTRWQVNAWLFDPQGLYFASKNYLLKANIGYTDINVETGVTIPIEFRVKTREFSLGNPLSQKNVQFVGLIFKQGNEDISHADIIVHMGYESYAIRGIDLAESLIWGRQWGKMWGYRESIFKMAELIRTSNTFQLEIINNNLNDPITLIGVGFIYEETDLVTPNILKDEVLLQ
jgi:hypothetical protein